MEASSPPQPSPSLSAFRRIAPGLLVAATGVGAGDLVTASLAGSDLGYRVLWAAWVGAALKWVLNEGLARWQLATGTTLIEGWRDHLGRWVNWLFLVYLGLWTIAVGGSLIKACAVAAAALAGTGPDSLFWWGAGQSLLGLLLVLLGRFTLFETLMSLCIGLMFLAVTCSALKVGNFTGFELWKGLLIPSVPAGGLGWTLGVMGGVGGTVTLLSYGYWIKEQGRAKPADLKDCRIDLGVGYAMTAFFGIAMIVIGSQLPTGGKGNAVALGIAHVLGSQISPVLGWLFLVGFWAAVFSSLLGVWQGVPYLFADFWRLKKGHAEPGHGLASTSSYRGCLLFLAIAPLAVQSLSLKEIAWLYAVLGSLFMPFLAATLLYLNGWKLRGHTLANPWWINTGLLATLIFFTYQGLAGLLS
jgi:Mn2+/Fe2+ NRAMP family transporter